MIKFTVFVAAAMIFIAAARIIRYPGSQNNSIISPAERQSLRDAPSETPKARAERIFTYELVNPKGFYGSRIPNVKRVNCAAMGDMQLERGLLLVAHSNQEPEPCKLFDQLAIFFPWNDLEAQLYGKKAENAPTPAAGAHGYPCASGDAHDKFGNRWQVMVEPDYASPKAKGKSLIDKSWDFKRIVRGNPNYELMVRNGRVTSARISAQSSPAGIVAEKKIPPSKFQQILDSFKHIADQLP